ncbi:MAG: TonB-dependent receptor [Gammaproteobacteria bacterium]|nr:TonB-dependent receptor [Gammaproteobacteria bacterium]
MQDSFRHRRVLLTALISSLIHGVAVAQDEQIPTISVTAPAMNESQDLNATAVDAQDLNALAPATSDTASLLKNIPGLTIQGSGGVSGLPVIRGLADDRLRIKVDGMDLISACGNHMNPPLSYIDPTNVETATVFAGISPVSVGGDSIGGAIIVESADPEFATAEQGSLFKGEVGFFARSNGNAYGDNLKATAASENFSMTYSSSTAEAENYKAGGDFKTQSYVNDVGDHVLDGDEVGSSMYKSTNRSLSFAMRNENHMAELKLGMQDIPYQGWTNQRMDMTGNDSTQINLHYKGNFDWGDLDARAYNEKTRHAMQFYDDKLYWYGSNDGVTFPEGESCTLTGGQQGCAAGMPMDTQGDNSGVVVKGELSLSANDLLRVGGEVQQYQLDDWWDPSGKGMWPNTFWNINNGERDRVALFGEWEAQWNKQWLSLLGVRGEQVDMNAGDVQGYSPTYSPADAAAFNAADRNKTDDNIDLTALARFTPDDTQTIEFGYAMKTRSPNLYERYTWSTHGMSMRMINWAGDGNGYVGNLDLEPEIAHTVSATFDWHDAAQKEWGLKVTPYYTTVDDYIDAERCSGASTGVCTTANTTVTDAFVYLRYVNQSATIYGLDVSGHYPLAETADYGSFTMNGMMNYVKGENDDTSDNLYNMMPLNARLAVAQKLNRWSNSAELELVDAKTDVSWERNEMTTAGYGLLHLRSSYQWKQLRFDVGIENALDRFYNHPLGGTYLGEGKTMSGTAVAWGTPVPGMGRSLYAGVNVKF